MTRVVQTIISSGLPSDLKRTSNHKIYLVLRILFSMSLLDIGVIRFPNVLS
jgi:hypothetical protein